MQNKHYFFFSFLGIPTFGEGGGSSRLGQNPNFYRKFVLHASLILSFKIKSYSCQVLEKKKLLWWIHLSSSCQSSHPRIYQRLNLRRKTIQSILVSSSTANKYITNLWCRSTYLRTSSSSGRRVRASWPWGTTLWAPTRGSRYNLRHTRKSPSLDAQNPF